MSHERWLLVDVPAVPRTQVRPGDGFVVEGKTLRPARAGDEVVWLAHYASTCPSAANDRDFATDVYAGRLTAPHPLIGERSVRIDDDDEPILEDIADEDDAA